MSFEQDRAEEIEKILYMRSNPDIYIEHILGETLEGFQKRVCQKFAKYDRLNVKACHAVGKTYLLARLAHSFLFLYESSKVITTAPTYRQVVTLLWGELRKAHKNAKTLMGGKLLNNSLTIDDDWFAIGFSPAKGADTGGSEQQGSSFQGFHAPYILIIFDEATGVPRDIYTMAEGLMTSGVVVKWVCIANPTTRACEFFKNTKLAEWHTHTINCYDSPNMIANGFTNRESLEREILILKSLSDEERLTRIKNYQKPNPHLLNAQWAVAKLYQWGFNHPLSKSKILGEFPDNEDNVIIPYDSLQAAFNRELDDNVMDTLYIGVDAARFGDDQCVITAIRGWKWLDKDIDGKIDGEVLAGKVIAFVKKYDVGRPVHIVLDATGVGASCEDFLKVAKREKILGENIYIHAVHFAQSILPRDDTDEAKEKAKELNRTYANLKAFMFFQLEEDLRKNIDLPSEEIYEEELPAIKYTFTGQGKLIVEDKAEFKTFYGKSPDHADSAALANLGRYLPSPFESFERYLPTADDAKEKPHRLSVEGRRTESRIKVKEQ